MLAKETEKSKKGNDMKFELTSNQLEMLETLGVNFNLPLVREDGVAFIEMGPPDSVFPVVEGIRRVAECAEILDFDEERFDPLHNLVSQISNWNSDRCKQAQMASALPLKPRDRFDEDIFWEVIDEIAWDEHCRKERGYYNRVSAGIVTHWTPEFYEKFDEFRMQCFSEVSNAIDRHVEEISDDAFTDLVCHLVGMGHQVFLDVLKNPETVQEKYGSRVKESFGYCFHCRVTPKGELVLF